MESLICLICSFLFCFETFAKEVKLCGNIEQGELLYGIAKDATKIKFSDKEYDDIEFDDYKIVQLTDIHSVRDEKQNEDIMKAKSFFEKLLKELEF